MRRLASAMIVLLPLLLGCASRPPPRAPATAPRAATATAAALPSATASPSPFATPMDGPRGPLPLSIQRILSEEARELADMVALGPVGDARGRIRAASEVGAIADELSALEKDLRVAATQPEGESGRLDAIVTRLLRLVTRIELLHDAIRVAAGPTTAVEVEAPPAAPK